MAFTIMPRSASPLTDSLSRTGRYSPLSLPAAHDASPTRRLSTPRRRRSVPNATSKTRSRRSENASPSRSQNPSRDVHAVSQHPDHLQPDCVYDTVKVKQCRLIRFFISEPNNLTPCGRVTTRAPAGPQQLRLTHSCRTRVMMPECLIKPWFYARLGVWLAWVGWHFVANGANILWHSFHR